MAVRRRKQRRGRSYAWRYRGRIVACVFVEVLIICALVIMVGWNKGVKEWFEQFEQPDQKYFSKVFKEYAGVSAKQFALKTVK